MADRVDAEVLDHAPRRWHPGAGTKVLITLLVAGLVLAAVMDRRARATEREALDTCSTQIEAAVESALTPVSAMANYVRPTRDGAAVQLSLELDAMVSEVAAAALPALGEAATACDEVQVWSHHLAAAERKQSCLDRVARAERHLQDISRDGATYFRSSENLLASSPC